MRESEGEGNRVLALWNLVGTLFLARGELNEAQKQIIKDLKSPKSLHAELIQIWLLIQKICSKPIHVTDYDNGRLLCRTSSLLGNKRKHDFNLSF